MSDNLRIALAQLNFLVGDINGNTEKIIESAVYARDEHHADVIVFSELSVTGYPLEDLLFRPVILDRIDNAIEKIKNSVCDITLIIGTPRNYSRT